ncbi:STAS domain-containing protein [Phytomonospora endophytica]|uniref:Anti-sigma factor antagonist n=1 Tax=Phytomonospora endophytica TaxID=714109 RepID=A0A841FJ73_9ACTN|nr:STAS domain-containing protein [Phytomonospora endophytica]MBB6035865.1 anti-sigma B factor antagonist [Phytomonospora endophytica]GIG71140.1 hypothetical protein Pen01_74350 [Phytomonospora endophytica]
MTLPEYGFGFTSSDHAGYRVVKLVGELDVAMLGAQEAEFLALFVDAPAGVVVLDFADVAFCDSTGLGILIKAARYSSGVSGHVRIAAAQEHIARLITSSALDRALPLFPTIQAAAAPAG